jgi:hypothetical protein
LLPEDDPVVERELARRTSLREERGHDIQGEWPTKHLDILRSRGADVCDLVVPKSMQNQWYFSLSLREQQILAIGYHSADDPARLACVDLGQSANRIPTGSDGLGLTCLEDFSSPS